MKKKKVKKGYKNLKVTIDKKDPSQINVSFDLLINSSRAIPLCKEKNKI